MRARVASLIPVNALDLFVLLFAVGMMANLYFTKVQPLSFSKNIIREEGMRFVEMEVAVDQKQIFEGFFPQVGNGVKDVYGGLQWEVLGIEPMPEGKKVRIKARLKQNADGHFHYGKYLVEQGKLITLTNPQYYFRGTILTFKLLDEPVPY